MSLIVLLQARNEERYLPGWLENIGGAVDGIVALDDGSTDRTAEILSAHPRLLSLLRNPPGRDWDQPRNQLRLIEEGRRLGATWFLALDADERVERSFSAKVRELIASADPEGIEAYLIQVRELWGDRHHYRCDGIWARKAQYRLFRNVPGQSRFDAKAHHRTWMPLEIKDRIATVGRRTDLNIYHLKTITPAGRAARAARHEALDPDHRFQSTGYSYMIDDQGLQLRRIPPERGFLPLDDPGVARLGLVGRVRSWASLRRASLDRNPTPHPRGR
ncbi:MAG: glycosyltransferase family 2 protein [Bauldia sp.]|nr:glycosyltransferase family 2 protein [Bauldia sp.]